MDSPRAAPDVSGAGPERAYAYVEDPKDRPRKVRSAVRVILTTPEDQVLLLEDSDPGLPGRRWWVTPGGGIDPGETEVEAAVREVAEETGLVLDPVQLLGPVGRRLVVHGYSDEVLEQEEAFFVARVPRFDVVVDGYTEEEKVTLQQHRWWNRSDLEDTDAWVWPAQLVQLCDLADHPEAWPLQLGRQEESTRPDVSG